MFLGQIGGEDIMNNKIILIMAILALMLIVGIASAKPVIKEVDIDMSSSNNADAKVKATDDEGKSISDVKANDNDLYHSDDEIWSNSIPLPHDVVKFEAKNDDQETKTAFAKRGGCPESYSSHQSQYEFAHVEPVPISGKDVTFYLTTTVGPTNSAIIAFCVYSDNPKSSLSEGPNAGSWDWVPKFKSRYIFGFGRLTGNDNIPLDEERNLNMGTAHYEEETYSDKILMHIYDPIECSKDDDWEDDDSSPGNTCWRRPGTPTVIPEFPTFVIPVAATLAIMFIVMRRKKVE